MGARWHSFTRTDAAVAEGPPACSTPQPPPPRGQLLRSLLCSEEVCGRPEEFQQSFVAPVDPAAPNPAAWHSRQADCTGCTSGAPLGLGGETAVTSTVSQKEEKMRVCLKELQGHCGLGVTTDRVILSAHGQNGNSHFVHIPQGFVAFPVGIPRTWGTAASAGPGRCCRSSLTEQRLLQDTQGAAGKQSVCLYGLTQRRLVPMYSVQAHRHKHTHTHEKEHKCTLNRGNKRKPVNQFWGAAWVSYSLCSIDLRSFTWVTMSLRIDDLTLSRPSVATVTWLHP